MFGMIKDEGLETMVSFANNQLFKSKNQHSIEARVFNIPDLILRKNRIRPFVAKIRANGHQSLRSHIFADKLLPDLSENQKFTKKNKYKIKYPFAVKVSRELAFFQK